MTLKDGSKLKADGQLAGTPSVLFDAVALVLSEEGCSELLNDGAPIDFAKNAFGHLKAIGFSAHAQPLLDKAGVETDQGVLLLKMTQQVSLSRLALAAGIESLRFECSRDRRRLPAQ